MGVDANAHHRTPLLATTVYNSGDRQLPFLPPTSSDYGRVLIRLKFEKAPSMPKAVDKRRQERRYAHLAVKVRFHGRIPLGAVNVPGFGELGRVLHRALVGLPACHLVHRVQLKTVADTKHMSGTSQQT